MANATQRAAIPTVRQLKIAVISDMHAFDSVSPDEKPEPSHLCTRTPTGVPSYHPISALDSLIASDKITANLLLCPGDLGDKARPGAISYAWAEVNKIAAKLQATEVIATVGNHDIDSRLQYSDHDPKGFLQTLVPSFPFPRPREIETDRFWSRNFALLEETDYRLLVLNSSAFHGTKDEYKHGRVSQRTIDAIKQNLSTLAFKPVNIVLCHHHPHKHSEIELGEYDEMLGGQLLLDLLGSGTYGDWFILHGHKHHPKISYASGGCSAPVVFSAGSLCAKLYPELASVARNQFYVITFPIDEFSVNGFVGTFDAWDWIAGMGWQRAGRTGSGLPGHGGFGFRSNLNLLVGQVFQLLANKTMAWDSLLDGMPQLRYLIPSDLDTLITRLKSQHGVEVLMSPEGDPKQIGRTS